MQTAKVEKILNKRINQKKGKNFFSRIFKNFMFICRDFFQLKITKKYESKPANDNSLLVTYLYIKSINL